MADVAVPDPAPLLHMYEVQFRIVQCAERVRSLGASGRMPLGFESRRGQEGVSAALAEHLLVDDVIVTTHPGLAEHVAKGVPLPELLAEYLGRATGTGKGKGGPAHITHPPQGVTLTTAGPDAGVSVADGLGLAAQLDGSTRVVVVVFDDRAVDAGACPEAVDLAAVWKLPVVFVCRRDQTGSPLQARDATDVPCAALDGNDPLAMWNSVGQAVARARAGGGPTVLDAAPAEGVVARYRAWLLAEGHASGDDLAALEARVAAEVEDAVRFALESPPPDESELLTDVHAEVHA